MRSGTVLAIVVAIAVVIGGFVWYTADPGFEHDSTEQTITPDDAILEPEEAQREGAETDADATAEDATAEEATPTDDAAVTAPARQASGTDATEDATDTATRDDAATEQDAIVVGDEITEDATVVQSATDEAVILDPDETETSVAIVDEPAGAEGAAPATASAAPGDPEDLLTPANFDPQEVLALIADAEELSAEQRSSLRALVEGARANPALQESAIERIRDALDLPPL